MLSSSSLSQFYSHYNPRANAIVEFWWENDSIDKQIANYDLFQWNPEFYIS
jgi:hypothetical protein